MLIPVGDIEVSVARHGTGDPFVLVHGFTGSAKDWDGVVDELAKEREVITVEHRGHGASSKTGDAAGYTFDQLVTDFAGVVDALGLTRFDLLGHSMGGIVAMRYALAQPARLRSLILMDTGAAASNFELPSARFMRSGIELAKEGGMQAVYDAVAPHLGNGEEGDHAREAMRTQMLLLDPVGFVALGSELLTHASVLDSLATLAMPTTVIVGVDDKGLRGAADDLAATIPGAVLHVIPDAAHSPQVENRDAWARVVQDHLDGRP